MKKILRKFILWLFKTAEIDRVFLNSNKESCCIVKDDKFLYLAMPNGEIIPIQRDLKILSNLSDGKKGICEVQITVYIPLDEKMPNRELYNILS